MKAMLISFAVGLIVGVAYGPLRVKSPAPPLIALVGLLGMVWGEQAAERFLLKPPPSATAKGVPAGDGASSRYCGTDGIGPAVDRPDRSQSR